MCMATDISRILVCSVHAIPGTAKLEVQRPWVYPYPSVSDFAGRNSDRGPSKTQTKTQTRERRNSDHGGTFRPRKKKIAPPPPPQISQFAADTLLAPRRTPPPPPGLFTKKPIPHSLPAPRLPLPLRNVHQVYQGKTPWVDSACADCPGFSGPGWCSCPRLHLRLGASDCSPRLAFCFTGPWKFAWICCPQLPYHPCKNPWQR